MTLHSQSYSFEGFGVRKMFSGPDQKCIAPENNSDLIPTEAVSQTMEVVGSHIHALHLALCYESRI